VFIPLIDVRSPVAAVGSERARALFAVSAPQVPQAHLFQTGRDCHLFMVNGSRVYTIEDGILLPLASEIKSRNPQRVEIELSRLGLNESSYIDDASPASPPVRALSLAVAQKCNLGCTYCYAQEGDFGSTPKNMSLETALRAVDLLLSEVEPGERVNLAFLGGEPLANRQVVRATTERAVQLANEKGARIGFSITTNGTLLIADDGEFFERHGFAVTVSLDGISATHDGLRPFKGGQGSYDRIMSRVQPLLAMQHNMQVSARVTVTPRNLRLMETLDGFIGLGFHSVGFSPMLSSPAGRDQMSEPELEVMLDQMVTCGEEFERQVIAGRRYPFLNMVNALKEIHKGTHRPYSCGAGAGYFGVSAEGELSACHRFVGDEAGTMGSLVDGVDRTHQTEWLTARHVHRQEPCRRCWARYMCGGGCHHEVIHRGRPACNYIRGWLHYCLQAYIRLSEKRPDYFSLAT
jgi:uncharacterized protein